MNKNIPDNLYTIRVGSAKAKPFRRVIRPKHRTAFGVAQEYFPDVKPGEHYEKDTYRFMSTSWGWVYISVRPTIKDDYADPQNG